MIRDEQCCPRDGFQQRKGKKWDPSSRGRGGMLQTAGEGGRAVLEEGDGGRGEQIGRAHV